MTPPSEEMRPPTVFQEENSIPVIESGSAVVTHINVFTVDPEREQDLAVSLTETVDVALHIPVGFQQVFAAVSTTARSSLCSFESHEAAQGVAQQLLAVNLIQRNTAIESLQPAQYEVVCTASND